MLPMDAFVMAILAALILVIIFLFLMLRKTVLSYKEGYKSRRR